MSPRERIALVGLFAVVSCPKVRPPETHEALITRIDHAGCAEVAAGPICELEGPGELVLWVDAPEDATLAILLTVASKTDEVESSWTSVDGGRRTTVSLPTNAKHLDVVARRTGVDRWRLGFRPRVWNEAVRVADRAFAAGRLTEAQDALDALNDTSIRDPRSRADIARVRARLAMARGDGAEAVRRRAEAVRHGRDAGLLSKVVNEQLSLAFIALMANRDVARARAALEEVDPAHLDVFASGAVNRDYYFGILAAETGDLRNAVRMLERAKRGAERLGLDATAWGASQGQVTAFTMLGMTEVAEGILASWKKRGDGPGDACSEATTLDNSAWVALTATELGKKTAIDPVAASKRALQLWEGACPRPDRVTNTLTNLALGTIQRGDVAAAKQHLKRAREISNRHAADVELWMLDLEGRVALAERRTAAARRSYQRLDELASASASPDGRWRAALGRAEVFRARGEVARAIRAFDRAEAMLDEQLAFVSLGPARSRFAASRSSNLAPQIDLLARHGTPAQVAAAIERRRARILRGLRLQSHVAGLTGDPRRAWDEMTTRYLSLREQMDKLVTVSWGRAVSRKGGIERRRRSLQAQLLKLLDDASNLTASGTSRKSPTKPHDLTLAFHPLPDRIVAVTTSRVVSIPLWEPTNDPHELSKALLEPFARELEGTDRIRFVAQGWLADVDLHALPWRDGPLVHTMVVTYAVGAGGRGANQSGTTLIVADPIGDLPSARDEGRAVRAALAKSGRSAELLFGADAHRRTIIAALGRAAALHFAGHGRQLHAGGWESVLPLASSTELSVADILALPAVPARVVLSGCETAQTNLLRGPDLGPARAFVVRGAEIVVAASRPVRDETAHAITSTLYEDGSTDLAGALRRAQLKLSERTPAADWAAFRALVP